MGVDEERNRRKRRKQFMCATILFALLFVLYYFEKKINPQDTTIFAFSYRYGFISRGLLGSFWIWLDAHTSISLMNFHAIYRFTQLVTVVYFVVLLWFYSLALKKSNAEDEKKMYALVIFLSVFTFPMFLSLENFGRLDEYLMIGVLVCLLLLICEKAEWLIVPICMICTIAHQGFVFLEVNIILVLLLYKVLKKPKKQAMKYLAIFVTTFLVMSGFFVYFEFYSHVANQGVYNEIVANAKAISQDGNSYLKQLVDHEILGIDVFNEEKVFHVMNWQELPVFVLFFLPYIVIGMRFFIGLIKQAANKKEKLAYLFVALGPMTVVPEILLKVDLGRYLFSIFFYYIAIVIALMALQDELVRSELKKLVKRYNAKLPLLVILIFYPILFMPFLDVHTDQLIWNQVQILRNHF